MAVVRPLKSAGGHSYVEEKALGDPAVQAAEVDADFDTIYSAVNAIPAGPPGPTGPQGPPGPTGPGVPTGGTAGQQLQKTSATDFATAWITPPTLVYRHVQATAATTWAITHNLPFRPNVAAVDSTGREMWPGAVDYPDAATVQLTFSAAVGGEAYLS
jgi:hypothetical protein